MTFDALHHESNCNCIEGCIEDINSHWGLKTNKANLREVDFKSKFEKGKAESANDCEVLCSYKGVSMSIVKNAEVDNTEAVITIYKQLFPIAPGYRPFLSIIKFKQGLGVIKCSPLSNNLHHHDFYKCDNFVFTEVELINTISLAEIV
jgi:hypothetical protein